MLRKSTVLFFVVIALIVFTGCQKAPSAGSVQKIELLQIDGFTQTDSVVLATFTEQDEIQPIVKAIETSTKIDGILDVTAPSFGLKLYDTNDAVKTYYLWVGQDTRYNGMIMDVEDTHTGYTLTEEAAEMLFTLIQRY
ncbi:MAG: hypothetical protein SCK29_08910 [Bacillota bacterium]|nr:hypothetical protein [Bacillota bacterium]MDW7684219.1 hypothetical protein [Bacillota bacterium]